MTFGRAASGRVWHGFAVLSAGKAARPVWRGTGRSCLDMGGMQRKPSPSVAFFTERTLAEYLAVSDRTVRNWIRRGDLPSYKLGAARRIDPADVEDFLARHREAGA